MNLTCAVCFEDQEVDGEDLPDCACDETEYECKYCGTCMMIGWVAEAEVRSVICERGDLDEAN